MFITYCSVCGIKVDETDDFKWLQENIKTIKCENCSNRKPQSIQDFIKNIPKLPQVQYGTTQQLTELKEIADRLGLYDASNYITKIL
jgi:hypothetical protein